VAVYTSGYSCVDVACVLGRCVVEIVFVYKMHGTYIKITEIIGVFVPMFRLL